MELYRRQSTYNGYTVVGSVCVVYRCRRRAWRTSNFF